MTSPAAVGRAGPTENDLIVTPVKGRGAHGLELTGQFCARRGLLVGVEGGLGRAKPRKQ